MWYVYIVKCNDKTLYTGVTNDLQKRIAAHNSDTGGAKYTRGRQPVRLVYKKRKRTRQTALREEAQIKKMTRREKQALLRKAKN